MRLKLLACLALFCCAPCGYAEIIADKLSSAMKLGVDQNRIAGPDGRTEDLPAVGVSWHTPWTSFLRQTAKISYLADYTDKSQAMNVYHEIFQLFLGVELSHPWLFRWHIAAGPLFTKEKVHYDFKTDAGTQRSVMIVNGLGSFYQAGVDYAFSEDMECSFILGSLNRNVSPGRKSDFYYGIAAVWNISLFWHEYL